MKIGFSILSHKEPDLLFRNLLLQLEQFPDKEIAIHHDFNQAEFGKSLSEVSSFKLVTDYSRTYWSHTNNVKAIMETFKILYSRNCDWYITLSANCYPIKPVQYIIDFLSSASFDGFIEINNVLTDHYDFYQYFRKGFQTKYLFQMPFMSRKGKLYQRVIRRSRSKKEMLFDESYIPYHGSDWYIINMKCIEYILNNETEINTLVEFLANVNKGPDINVCPPEVVFQTILGNNNNLKLNSNYYRFIDWKNAKGWHPNILTMEHWNDIERSDALFARKFDWNQSKELLERIDNRLIRH